ncbi:MAG TPA: hypothetical protein VFV57_05800 [Limnobacter sp.]|nr:hypothetical protein [Limnobacter sp.]
MQNLTGPWLIVLFANVALIAVFGLICSIVAATRSAQAKSDDEFLNEADEGELTVMDILSLSAMGLACAGLIVLWFVGV